jgi:MFS family permease
MAESRPAVLSETAAPPLLLRAAGRVRANARLIGLLALGHLIVDVNQGSLSAVLPFAKSAHRLSYAQVGILVLMANVTSSIIQPIFGYVADRTSRRWILPASLLVSGAGIGLTGLAGSYETLLAAIGGLAAAALGGVADRWGVPAALWISALLPLAAFVGARFLPAPRARAPGIA